MLPEINGFAAEQMFRQSCYNAKIPQHPMKTKEVVAAVKQTPLGRNRLSQILPYLHSQYAHFHWQDVPVNDLLDQLGLDFLLNFRGWLLGIDVTANPEAIEDKQSKLAWLSPLWESLQIDSVAVAYVTHVANKGDLIQKLREVRQGSSYIQL